MHFQDARAPQEILAVVERDIMKVFSTSTKEGKLIYSTGAKINGATYQFELCFEAAWPQTNAYSLRVDAAWSEMPAQHHDYYRKSTDSWVKFWVRDFKEGDSMAAGAGSAERYAKIRNEAMEAESQLNSVTAIQQAIVAGMKRGETFSTAHKEGGTIFKWAGMQFIRSDYGDFPDLKTFANEAEFLKALRQFYDWQTFSAVHPHKPPELDVWRLILRKL